MRYVISYVLAILIAIAAIIFVNAKRQDCEDRGGVYVRSMWNYECLEAIKK